MKARVASVFLAVISLVAASRAVVAEDEKFNYDEAKVPAYQLPDLLTLSDGHRVTTAEAWPERRRELLDLFEKHVYGRRPKLAGKLSYRVEESVPDYLVGLGRRKLVHAELITGPTRQELFSFVLIVPDAKQPVPAFVGMHLFDTAAPKPVPGKPLTEDVGIPLPGEKLLETILKRGYAIATLDAKNFCPDDKAHFRDGVMQVLSPDKSGPPSAEEAGAIGTWAWALSRTLDYLEQDGQIDAKRVAVIGHSRMGKTALWAGAEDERFALVISNDSGCGGAALSRRWFGETVTRINNAFPHWFCGNFKQYDGHEDRLPVDQHELIALSAPRPVYVASAVEDGWADPRGEFLATLAAEPVYRLLGLEGLGTSELPPLNQSVGGSIGYHIRAGKHALTDFDWLKYLDWADKHWADKHANAKHSGAR